MNKGHSIVSLLAVIAVMLGLNLIVDHSPRAVADNAVGPQEPYVLQISATSTSIGIFPTANIYRLWSDGSVDAHFVRRDNPGGTWIPQWIGYIPLETGLRADTNADGCVGAEDLAIVLGYWGSC